MFPAPPPYPRFRTRPTPEAVDTIFTLQRQADPLGLRFHLPFACIAVFLAGFPTTFIEWAALPLAVICLVRMITHHRVLGPLFWDPLVWCALAFAGWFALSTLWMAGTGHQWFAEFQIFRFAVFFPLLYPVLDHRRTLILALTLGLLCGQISQLIHFIGIHANLPALTWHRFPDRISGWWDPVVAGSLLCACLGLALGFLLPLPAGGGRGVGSAGKRSRRGVARAALLLLTLFCIFITGTRGAWIAAAILITIFILLIGVPRLDRHGRGVPRLDRRSGRQAVPSTDSAGTTSSSSARTSSRPALLLALLIPLLVTAAFLASPALRARLDRGITEVRAALTTSNYESDTGRRLAMWRWALIEFKSHPLRGVGAGGYLPYARSTLAPNASRPTPNSTPSLPLPHAHAHSWPLHTLATLGLIGLALLVALLFTALRPPARPSLTSSPPHLITLSDPVSLALLGLTLAGLFDTIFINQQTANLLFILLALSVRYRPSVAS